MGQVTPIRRNGATVGYQCQHGHNHGSNVEAQTCDPDAFTEKQNALTKEEAAQRKIQIAQDPDFSKAVVAAKQLGASEDDAEGVVFKNGCAKVIAVRDSVAGLGIPKQKKKADDPPKDPPKTT